VCASEDGQPVLDLSCISNLNLFLLQFILHTNTQRHHFPATAKWVQCTDKLSH